MNIFIPHTRSKQSKKLCFQKKQGKFRKQHETLGRYQNVRGG